MNVDAAFRTAKHAVRAFLAVLALATTAVAQDWPKKTVRIVVPFGPGTSSRALSPMACSRNTLPAHLSWRTSPGAGDNLGTDLVAKATPDGSTIGVSIGGPLAINTLLYARLPYDPRMDIATVTQLVTQPSVLAVNPALGVSSVADLIALLRKNPGKYNFASIGNGSLSHLAMEAIAIKPGAQLVHIPYPSSPQAITAVIRNDAQIACLPAIAVTPRAETGAVKILAVSTEKRSPYLPDLPR
jgi:tripartite-type tricarboxylate transporter receptor subunit TctC